MTKGNTRTSGRRAAAQNPLLETCSQIGAMIVGQKHERMQQGVEILRRQAGAELLRRHLDEWVPRFEHHLEALEQVVGRGLELGQASLVNDLKSRVKAAGFANMRQFIDQAVMPVVGYHGLLLHLNNAAGVALPPQTRALVAERTNAINRVLGGACAAMFMQESMGL